MKFRSHLDQHARHITNTSGVRKDIITLGYEGKDVEDGIERNNDDKKLIINILKVFNPDFSKQYSEGYSKKVRNNVHDQTNSKSCHMKI